jgi:2-polyprenyl-3-methyl-5-hydroxy-6-metoxy-1,4-benzoquinol methylase
MAGRDDWLSVANADDPDEVRERILTGYRDGKPFTPYVPTVPLPDAIERVLDFGCGLGRNFPYLTSIAREVVGFDLPPMIERCRTLSDHPVTLLTSDWQEVSRRRYDLIVATLVLQHVETAVCRVYLKDFARLAPVTYVLTRVRNDFDANVLQLIADTQLFDAGACVEVDHDPATHQLRVLGREAFDTLRLAADGGHYEVVLRSRM